LKASTNAPDIRLNSVWAAREARYAERFVVVSFLSAIAVRGDWKARRSEEMVSLDSLWTSPSAGREKDEEGEKKAGLNPERGGEVEDDLEASAAEAPARLCATLP
jgi:hypothetical protein